MRMEHGQPLAGVDLNLIPLLDALLGERHVTRAAARVGLSQPAASRGLARLRALLDDPLLVRGRAGLSLTPRAQLLAEPVRQALATLAGALSPAAPFEPAASRRAVRLASDDYTELVLLPGLLARLGAAAPGIDLWIEPPAARGVAPLVEGDVDFMVAPPQAFLPLAPGIHSELLYEERFVSLVRRDHPFAKRRPSVDRFAEARHAFIAPRGRPGGPVDEALAARGKARRVALAVPHFLVVPFLVAASDLVLTLGERVARTYARMLPVAIFEPPLTLPTFAMHLLHHERNAHDPALEWVAGQLRAAAAALRAARARSRPRTRSG
jgi:DNA-binding transcriptional LysR family regulator